MFTRGYPFFLNVSSSRSAEASTHGPRKAEIAEAQRIVRRIDLAGRRSLYGAAVCPNGAINGQVPGTD